MSVSTPAHALEPGRARGISGRVPVALALLFLSGAAGVGHQLLWTRRLVDLLGASSETFSRVVGAFFVGLALGAWLSTRYGPKRTPAWRAVAAAEMGVALLALPLVCLPQFEGLFRLIHWPAARVLLPLLFVVPPAVAMGLVIPWTIQAMAGEQDREERPHLPVWLYAANTAGGVLIIPALLLFVLPKLGLTGASLVLVGLNVLVAGGAWSLTRNSLRERVRSLPGGGLPSPFEKGVAFASGFLVLGFEVVLQQQLAQVTINSLFSSGAVLVLVLIPLALAAALAPWLARRLGSRAMPCALVTAALLALIQPFCLFAVRGNLQILPYELMPLPYLAELLKLGGASVLPLGLASGLIFPLLLLRAPSGGGAGRLLAWNGLGGWLGTELMQGQIAPGLGLWTSVTLLGAIYAALAVVAGSCAPGGSRSWRVRWGTLLLVGLTALTATATRRLPQATIQPGERLVAVRVSREGVVATVECGPDDWRMLFNNSYTLGGSRAQFNQERQAHLPILLHGQARRVACLGIATGSTVAGATLHSNVESIEAIELSPAVIEQAKQFFVPYNRGALQDRRVQVIADDARSAVMRREKAYDVVIGDLFLPWRTGEARLFSVEHFRYVRRSLRPGGVYCQWLPLFQLTRPQFETVARTFQTVFPDTFLVRGDFYADLPIVGLVGGLERAQVDWRAVSNRCAALRAEANVRDPLVLYPEGVAMMLLGPLPRLAGGPVNTLGNAWLEWDAGNNILGLRAPWFVGVPEAEFVREIHRAGAMLMPEGLRSAHDAGQFFLTLEVAARVNSPVLPLLKEQFEARLPLPLRTHQAADWSQWPMSMKPLAIP